MPGTMVWNNDCNQHFNMKKNIALITGGFSEEAKISYKSAENMLKHIDEAKWNIYLIDIRKDGWFFKNEVGTETSVDKNDFSIISLGKKIIFEAVLIGLHGTPGEDGKMQGYFDCLGIPYTSCNAAVSAITFNKQFTIALAARAGLNVARSVSFKKGDALNETAVEEIGFPVFVKPNCGGSSIGMSKVDKIEDLHPALSKAFIEDDTVLVERYIAGREFTIGVYKKAETVIPLPITEIITGNSFFDYEAKYEGKSQEVTPAEIPAQIKQQIEEEAVKIYRHFECGGMVRIDFIYDEQAGKPFMLEINTVPGQSEASIVPQQVRAAGLTLKEFYTSLIEQCF